MKIVAIIPARYQSSRFPGKPLADICGKPMIWWVYQQAMKVQEFHSVYVATDDNRIREACEQNAMQVIMTDAKHPTGTDRIAEVAQKVSADLYVNIQGDEPLLEPDTIARAIKPFSEDRSISVTNLMTPIQDPVEVVNFTIPKVIVNRENIALYLTRSPAPFPKGKIGYQYYKQVCVYAFIPSALEFFRNSPRGRAEEIEDIEILRFIENGYRVKYIEVDSHTVAVDTQKDLEKVREIIQNKFTKNSRGGGTL